MRRLLHNLLLGLFIFACLFWLTRAPLAPDRLYQSLPPHPEIFSRHQHLAQRFAALKQNPFMRTVAALAGRSRKDLDRDAKSAVLQSWLDRIFPGEAVLAFDYTLGIWGEPGWVITSQAGGRANRLRLLLATFGVEGYEYLETWRGRSIWRFYASDKPEQRKAHPPFTLTFAEGLMVGCICEDVLALRQALDRLDGLQPSLNTDDESVLRELQAWSGGVPDYAFARLPFPEWPGPLLLRITEITPDALRGELRMPGTLLGSVVSRPELAQGLGRLLGDIPIFISLIPADLVDRILGGLEPQPWHEALAGLLPSPPRDGGDGAGEVPPLALALLGGDFRGSFRGFRIPTLVAVRPNQDGQGLNRIWFAVETLNKYYPGSVSPEVIPQGSNTLYALTGRAGREGSSWLTGELRPAYTVLEDQLVLCSNLGSLRQLVARWQRQEASFEESAGKWFRQYGAHDAHGYVWIDLPRSGRTLIESLSAYSVKLVMEDPAGTALIRARLERIKDWAALMSPLRYARGWLNQAGKFLRLEFELGGHSVRATGKSQP